jgi:serine/threonine protein kinase
MLCQIAVRDHPHLIKLLFTYKFKNHYHLVFPFANTNLRGYWNDTGLPYWNKDTYCWFLHQIRGIASGLNAIHNYNTNLPLFGTRLTMPGSNITQSGLLKVDKGEDKYGRHGDIKPENILWSNELAGSGVVGKLQITDLGCGRFHNLESRSGVNAAGIPKTPTYMPPEVPLGHGISRAYDIWSFGCVVLEFVTWLLEGPQSIYGFSSARGLTALDGINDDTFFTVTEKNGSKTAALREGVKTWIARLRTNPRCSDMIKDLLDLVEFQLLAIDPKQRLNSEKVDTELRIIRERANNSLVYLLGSNPPASDQHLGVKLPKGPDTKYAPATDELQPTPPPEDTPMPDVQHNLPAIRIDRADSHPDAPDRKRKNST